MQALIQQGKPKEAETELLSVVSAEEATLDLRLDAFRAMLEVPGCLGALKSAADLILMQAPQAAQIPVQLTEMVLASCDQKVILGNSLPKDRA